MTENQHPERFEDPGTAIYDLLDEILAVCPQCKSCARIALLKAGTRDWFAPRRLVCLHCGYSREWAEREIRRGWHSEPATDDFFGEPLWLQISFGDEILWAYNLRHLTLIEGYVGAKLREHRKRDDHGWQNSSLINRLPRWISAAENRDAVLKKIQKLKDRYLE